MVSTINIVMMGICVLVSVLALAIPVFAIKRRSSKIETGLSGAVAYGALGYVWQYIFYMFLGVFLTRVPLPGNESVRLVIINLLLTFISTGCTALSLYWGIYLTNQKQLSLYRSAAVGIGFSLGKIGIDLIYPYVYSMYFSFQINAGTFHADEGIKNSILRTTTSSLITGTYKCLLMFVIIFTIALIMGHYYIQKNRKMTWLSVIVIYECIMIINLIVRFIFANGSDLGMDICLVAIFTVVAFAGGLILYHWFRYDEVEVNPLVLMRQMTNRE